LSTPTPQKTPRNPASFTWPAQKLSSSGSKQWCTELLSAVQELRQINQILQQPASDEGGDDLDAFGQYMALALKKLPINLVLECQEKLQSLLTRYCLMAVAPVTTVFCELPLVQSNFITFIYKDRHITCRLKL
jgi:hypothetical protein